MHPSKKHWKSALILFVAALAFRVMISLIFSNEIVVGSDQMNEITLGRALAGGNYAGVLDTYWAPAYPITIGLVSILVDSLVLPALLVSIVSGAIVVPLTFFIALQSYGERNALIAAAIGIFFPHLINSVIGLGSENIYILWILGSLISAWEAIKRNSFWLSIPAGLLIGLAYLTRPEAIGYLVFFSIGFVGFDVWKRRSVLRDALPKLLACILSAMLLAAPYVVYLHSQTGTWSISGKAQVNTLAGHIVNDSEADEIEPDKGEKPFSVFVKYFALNLIESSKIFPILVPSLLMMLVGLALFSERWDADRFLRESYLILFCMVTVIGYAAAVVQMRYFYVLLPIFFCWMARGMTRFSDWVHATLPSKYTARGFTRGITISLLVIGLFVYVAPLFFFMRTTESAWETRAYEERDAGLWLKQYSKPSPRIYSSTLRPAFYAEGVIIPPGRTDHNDIRQEIKDAKADYVVLSERSLKRKPFLKGLDTELESDPEFEQVYRETPAPGYKIVIFKVK